MPEPITITTTRQLDALVAEKVFQRTYDDDLPSYSTSMNAAVEILKINETVARQCSEGAWVLTKNAPLEICLAALRCEGVEAELKLEG